MSRIADASHLIRLLTDGQISGLDALTTLITGGGAVGEQETIYQHKAARVAGADATLSTLAGQLGSLWQYEGTPQTHGGVPGAFANPNNDTVGGLQQADPTGGRKKYVSSATAACPQQGTLILYDRLLHMGGMDATLTTAQNVNGGVSADVTRYTDGVGNWLCLETYTTIGTTVTTATAAYKDGADAAKTTQPIVFGGTSAQRSRQQLICPMSLAAGGSTVKGVTSVTLAASTTVAGNFGVSIIHPLLMICLGQGANSSPMMTNFLSGPMPEIKTDACLAWLWVAGPNQSPPIDAFVTFVEA